LTWVQPSQRLGKPVRVVNDADMQGLGAISGQGVELVTLGTGFGSACLWTVNLCRMEMAHHQFQRKLEQQLGRCVG